MTQASPTPDHAAPDHAAPHAADLAGAVEAILLTADRPVPIARLADAIFTAQTPDAHDRVRAAVEALNETYDRTGRSFRVEETPKGLRLMTRPEFATVLAAYHGAAAGGRLSRAALETLAVIAYRQPVTRADLEAIRGVSCGEVLRTLMDRRLVTARGRAEELGRPILYGTTREFLTAFGLASLRDLPSVAELQLG